MSAGELRELLAFEQRAITSDGYGNVEGAFAEEFQVAARVRPRMGGEEVMAARLAGRQLFTITVRYSSDTTQITTGWRARNVRSGIYYNIRTAVNVDERTRYIEMLAEEGVAT